MNESHLEFVEILISDILGICEIIGTFIGQLRSNSYRSVKLFLNSIISFRTFLDPQHEPEMVLREFHERCCFIHIALRSHDSRQW